MSKQKYYAVKQGRQPGIYTTWSETEKQVKGYSGAVYQSFLSYKEATAYLTDMPVISHNSQLLAYVDGSFNKHTNRYSYGVVLLKDGCIVAELCNSDNDDRYTSSYQIAGECFGCLNAIKWAKQHHYPTITIFYDYLGIEYWATGKWKAQKNISKDYIYYFNRLTQHVSVQFIKVKAHSGISMNERADQLAKQALTMSS